jgi:hypothetical protein
MPETVMFEIARDGTDEVTHDCPRRVAEHLQIINKPTPRIFDYFGQKLAFRPRQPRPEDPVVERQECAVAGKAA